MVERYDLCSIEEGVRRAVLKGMTKQQVDLCVKTYEDMNVWQVSTNRSRLTFVA